MGGVAHAHSPYATMFAQAAPRDPLLRDDPRRPLPRPRPADPAPARGRGRGGLRAEHGQGRRRAVRRAVDPLELPAVLVAGHGPFTWGRTPGRGRRDGPRPRAGGPDGLRLDDPRAPPRAARPATSRRSTSGASTARTPITVRRRRRTMTNMPKVRLGLVAVSRDCFPIELSRKRSLRVAEECRKAGAPDHPRSRPSSRTRRTPSRPSTELRAKKVNALVLYLGNFGPETPTTILAQKFDGPVMVAAAAEESGKDLVNGRGDAYCGMLNNSYNMGLRKLRPHVPEYPVGTPDEVARDDRRVRARRPGHAGPVAGSRSSPSGRGRRTSWPATRPIKPLYDLGVEVMENSELDLYDIFRKAEGDAKVKAVAADMAKELGAGNAYPDILNKLAQFEVALLKFMEANLGRLGVRRLRRQVLAGLRELLRLRPLLRQLPAGRARHPGRLRGRHLRRPERVHRRPAPRSSRRPSSTSTTPSPPT
ncbi:MAG: class II aldolase/adducin family protein [Candidatus Moduliflexus flocculans]|nr:class II aldolase/adducin family protein [Candidatus Moduliflexus flocculans]